jgi:hypothetical protein
MGPRRSTSTSDPALVRVAALVVLVLVLSVHVIGCSAPLGGSAGTAAAGVGLSVGDAVVECEPDARVVVGAGARVAAPVAPCPDPGVVPILEPPAAVVAAPVSPPQVLHQAAGSNIGRAVLLRHAVFRS